MELEEARPLPLRAMLALNTLWFGFSFQTAALLPVVVPAQILLLVAPGEVGSAGQAAYLGWLGAAGALVALAVQPLVGQLSDRLDSRWGRRRPWIVAGVALAVVGMASLAGTADPLRFGAAFLLLQIGQNAAIAAYQAMLPDTVPAGQRGAASGFLGVMQILGNAASLGLALLLLGGVVAGSRSAIQSGSLRYLAITSAALVVCCGVTLLGPREPSASAPDPGKRPRGLGRYRNYAWVFAARALVMMGLTLFLTFIEYYFARVAHVTNFVQATAIVSLVALGVAVLGAVGLGLLSDRTRRVPLAFAATLLMAVAALLFLVPGGAAVLWLLGAVFGLGYGAYMSVDWALAVDSLPTAGAVGRDLGFWSLASTLPGLAAPALGGGVISLFAATGATESGYRAVFVVAMVFFLAGAVAVLGIRERRVSTVGDRR
jgi:MFS family permease